MLCRSCSLRIFKISIYFIFNFILIRENTTYLKNIRKIYTPSMAKFDIINLYKYISYTDSHFIQSLARSLILFSIHLMRTKFDEG